jgi:hypothetical protein
MNQGGNMQKNAKKEFTGRSAKAQIKHSALEREHLSRSASMVQ